ncbi:uncharacterized protein C2orf42 isoform X1 [Procambarus clarkii]|uniref:uncharacterized protein C2orf42 isoform X1 n=2 Tax=Procambarus clarkii TaxID=6728 RepID=UPI001E67061D|nr:uncharacterized protein C2orf42-like isoform X1 [Procambarus clarkii]XP_045582895.1 uncharacterized protein C2orf42-like isoform X1 [Procambarus clarkii]
MPRDEKRATFLTDLGRATMRGVRRCHKCGTLNGTRGFSCKNKSCDVIFKEAGEKRKLSTEACRIIAGADAQIYSARVRDKGPDYRGFVQLPLIQSMDGSGDIFIGAESLGDPVLLVQMGARCYVEPCQRNFEKLVNAHPALCSHIRAASQCFKEAQSLTLKNSVLNSLPIPQSVKSDIWQLATDTPGPLVQRVSKNIMVVKCKPEALHPLGFLHFSFQQVRNKEEMEYKYYCGCRAFKIQPAARDVTFRKCVHLYACVVAFASDHQLSQEFSYYINMIQNDLCQSPSLTVSNGTGDENSVSIGESSTGLSTVGERSFLILNDSGDSQCQVEVEVLQEDSTSILDGIAISPSDNLVTQEDIEGKLEIQLTTPEGIHLRTSDGGSISVHQIPDNLPVTGLKRRQDDSVVQASSALLTLQEGGTKKVSSPRRPLTGACARKAKEPVDENTASFSFLTWLGSVTERINQTMHFGFSGKPEPLVFHMPKLFFDCLMERINARSKKKRLPNQTQQFIRKDAVPLGKFTKYTWKIVSDLHVRQIFDSYDMPLEITRSFIQNRDGTYKLFHHRDEDSIYAKGSPTQPLLRPQEYKTRLRIGTTSPGQKEPTPFIIEWIPDILPQSLIGELRIKFEFDHLHNGQLLTSRDPRTGMPGQSMTGVRSHGPLLAPRPQPQQSQQTSQTSQQISATEHIISIPITSDGIQSTENMATILTF